MAVEQQHGFPADDELTEAARLRIRLQRVHLDGRARRRRIPGPMRLIASLAGLIRYLLSKLRP